MADWEFKGKPALVVLDMQVDIVGEEGKCSAMGFAKATKEAGIIPKIQALLRAFREKKLPVVFVVAEVNEVCLDAELVQEPFIERRLSVDARQFHFAGLGQHNLIASAGNQVGGRVGRIHHCIDLLA